MIRSDGGRALLRAVVLPTAITLIVLATIVGAILHVSTSTSDELAAKRQYQLVKLAVDEGISAVAVNQEASTYWDDAVVRMHQRPLDLQWVDNNLGVWFHSYYKTDEVYLLDPANRPVYAMRDGRRLAPPTFRRVATPALGLARQLRARLVAGEAPPEDSSVKTAGAWEIATIGGRPAIISLKPIVSETGEVPQPRGAEYLHVSVRYLDGSFLERLSSLYGIDRPRFSWSEAGPASLAVGRPDGRAIGYIAWQPFEPGEQVEDQMTPVLVIALLIVGALISFLLWRIWRSRTELEASRAQAQHLAFHDSLTGLPNRALFEDRLELALSRRDADVAVLLLDLDRFKNVNDTLGHQAGDALIRDFGLRLSVVTRECDTISRFGGDEFAILVEEASLPDIHGLAKRILADVRRPFEIFGTQVYAGASIGVALSDGARTDRLELVRRADIAMYRAKEAGRNAYCVFTPDMDECVKLRGTIEEELRDALTSGRGLAMHYQPQVGRDGEIVGLEALIRWEHPVRGLIAPDQFISVAEDTGLIVPLGEWAVREACRASLRWPDLFIAVNLSPIQFRASEFLERVTRIVAETGADPRAIQLEVTERVLLDDDDAVKAILSRLRSAGFKIVLDDFGTGYSSLSYLRKFEVDKIKIDGSFVQPLGDASDSRAIVAAVLALGDALGVAVAAEGVETEQQMTFLHVAGCKEMQGHYFSRAVPEADVPALLGGDGFKTAAA